MLRAISATLQLAKWILRIYYIRLILPLRTSSASSSSSTRSISTSVHSVYHTHFHVCYGWVIAFGSSLISRYAAIFWLIPVSWSFFEGIPSILLNSNAKKSQCKLLKSEVMWAWIEKDRMSFTNAGKQENSPLPLDILNHSYSIHSKLSPTPSALLMARTTAGWKGTPRFPGVKKGDFTTSEQRIWTDVLAEAQVRPKDSFRRKWNYVVDTNTEVDPTRNGGCRRSHTDDSFTTWLVRLTDTQCVVDWTSSTANGSCAGASLRSYAGQNIAHGAGTEIFLL